jgi:hypothetical protein
MDRTALIITDEMADRGARRLWEMSYPVGAVPKPWKEVHEFTQQQLRHEARQVLEAALTGPVQLIEIEDEAVESFVESLPYGESA